MPALTPYHPIIRVREQGRHRVVPQAYVCTFILLKIGILGVGANLVFALLVDWYIKRANTRFAPTGGSPSYFHCRLVARRVMGYSEHLLNKRSYTCFLHRR